MASWMVHLRIADRLLDSLPGLSAVDFVVGNIAPDSGIPNEDWSEFTPSVIVSHFRVDHSIPKNICIPALWSGISPLSNAQATLRRKIPSFWGILST